MNKGLVRPMRIDDLEAIMEIEHASFSTPWSVQSFVAELKDNEYAQYRCLELDGRIIGYMGLWFILDEGHITNVAISPDYRGQHWGEFLMRSVMLEMVEQGMERMTLEVRVSNSPAQDLYKRMGFTVAGVRKGYYADSGEDALIMWAELGRK
ncbi:ribosomal protein S18-alanine N-acetyltransferase [Desulfosporosinus sp. PR]|uniref:ribosomal protein S18-alanine N-acetyltransferase n=1 Tax=Candidatus Desulfosporosinus nitrosoreducens TaxID=3401928 RepID=UPI0027F66ADB|nr:ribosomal protein S18-alanine N-acetyltransferase [Desulfosporosinus sp. PR]MDQ7093167.1 ribosomal protein S18-alanine N-acetyltransferase [Desulfosporosinus sp. PR]